MIKKSLFFLLLFLFSCSTPQNVVVEKTEPLKHIYWSRTDSKIIANQILKEIELINGFGDSVIFDKIQNDTGLKIDLEEVSFFLKKYHNNYEDNHSYKAVINVKFRQDKQLGIITFDVQVLDENSKLLKQFSKKVIKFYK
ncbi:MAG: hypothetical protein U9N34_03270 [Candidatus Cloacimonadota bacterium]|nr:hypothetical protein [Candidatus Cloacimonadota bacterium]